MASLPPEHQVTLCDKALEQGTGLTARDVLKYIDEEIVKIDPHLYTNTMNKIQASKDATGTDGLGRVPPADTRTPHDLEGCQTTIPRRASNHLRLRIHLTKERIRRTPATTS